jgi:hypothetical protein
VMVFAWYSSPLSRGILCSYSAPPQMFLRRQIRYAQIQGLWNLALSCRLSLKQMWSASLWKRAVRHIFFANSKVITTLLSTSQRRRRFAL